MIDDLIRAADPAADAQPDARSPHAAAMLAAILDQPRSARVARRSGRRPVRRVVIGGVLAGAAATVLLAAPMPWDHGGGSLTQSASAVTRLKDGSIRVVLRWSELADPARLQAELDRAGARTLVLTTDAEVASPADIPACALPYYGRPYSARAVEWDTPAANHVDGVIIHPAAFPADATFVIEVQYRPGTTASLGELSFMARGRTPTCAVPNLSAAPSATPSR
jgi:hypothetical protein